MSWRDELQRCSFRGVEFHYEINRERGGHRNTKHRFVNRSGVSVEQHGLEERQFSFTAYVMGDDVFVKRDALLEVLQTGGAGELVLGDGGKRINATVDSWSIDRSNQVGGQVRFSIEFTEDGTIAGPYEGVATGPAVLQAADQAESVAVDEFADALEILTWPDAVAEALRGDLAGAVARLTAVVPDRVWSAIPEGVEGLEELSTIRTTFEGLLLHAAAPVQNLVSGYLQLSRSALKVWGPGAASAWFAALPEASIHSAPAFATTRSAIDQNRSLVTQLESVAAAITLADLSARRAYGDRTELAASRDETLQAIRRARAVIADQGHVATYVQLGDLRSAVTADFAGRGENLADLIRVESAAPQNALQLSYDLYGDLKRAPDLLQRATTRHPGFLDQSLLVRDR